MKGNTNSTVEKSVSGGTSPVTWVQRGNVVTVNIIALQVTAGTEKEVVTGLPIPANANSSMNINFYMSANYGDQGCLGYITNTGSFRYNSRVSATIYSIVTYVTDA